jgi:hypothetical protein
MKIRNSSGPSIDPCGTAHFIIPGFERTPFIKHFWLLLERYDWIHFKFVTNKAVILQFIQQDNVVHSIEGFLKVNSADSILFTTLTIMLSLIKDWE